MSKLIQAGQPIGQNFYRVSLEEVRALDGESGAIKLHPSPDWKTGDRLFLPLFSQQKNFVGCISMEDPMDVERVNEEDLAPLELLALDLAVAIENANLQQNLIRSEKV